jgi:hypothetical protein
LAGADPALPLADELPDVLCPDRPSTICPTPPTVTTMGPRLAVASDVEACASALP